MTEYCCPVLEKVINEFDGPFSIPIVVKRETLNLESGSPAVTLYHLTPSGKSIASKGRATLFLDYCPFCGTKLRKE